MKKEYAGDSNKKQLNKVFFCKLTACLIILFVAYGCAGNKTAIINAAGSGDISTIKSLQADGQNINEADSNGATPLMYAIWSKKTDVAKYLIEAGADVKAKDSNGYDALIYAIQYSNLDIINSILIKGVDVNSQDKEGKTPLYHAVEQGLNIYGIKQLLKSGADIYVKSKDPVYETITDVALSNGRMDIMVVLMNAGFKLWEPEHGKTRFFFIGEGLYDYVDVTVGTRSKCLKTGAGFIFIDVDPGNQTIAISPSKSGKAEQTLSVNSKAGQKYYFKVSQAIKRRIVHYFGVKIDSFILDTLKESDAKKDIELLLRGTK